MHNHFAHAESLGLPCNTTTSLNNLNFHPKFVTFYSITHALMPLLSRRCMVSPSTTNSGSHHVKHAQHHYNEYTPA
jgi:hypothetical protein